MINSTNMSRGKIPDRWIPYDACGKVIEGTRIICFKVPLHKNVQSRVPGITRIWDIPAVLEEIPNLGAVIDLTNTARYYNPWDFVAANVLHRKILMPGREIPPEDKVREFMDAVDEFLGKNGGSLVGVHCTHGLNRTGYMVCRYMRDQLKIPAQEAIKRFEKARGYKIERENYLADLLDKHIPPPDLGKATVIKPVDQQNYMLNEDAPEDEYVSGFVNYRYGRSNRYSDGHSGYGNERSNRNSGDTHFPWRYRGRSSSYHRQSSRENSNHYGGNRFSRDDGRSSSDRYSYSSDRYSYSYEYDY